ncbi:TPA: hypothetical protein N0F65_005224 [Lagenidium giganteum]|uniref:Uncharacterized protein n=1 Tax=Lagenidium giganteum TaxID=4803 RepID=A0AAV2YQM4_9STRA|nr:TPA: hypothetical protein N0F65_005224 [Lagenidium giganteum]
MGRQGSRAAVTLMLEEFTLLQALDDTSDEEESEDEWADYRFLHQLVLTRYVQWSLWSKLATGRMSEIIAWIRCALDVSCASALQRFLLFWRCCGLIASLPESWGSRNRPLFNSSWKCFCIPFPRRHTMPSRSSLASVKLRDALVYCAQWTILPVVGVDPCQSHRRPSM